MKAKTVTQSQMTEECWLVQIWGLSYCKTCEYRDTPDCGGKEVRKTGKNSKGYSVPLGGRRR